MATPASTTAARSGIITGGHWMVDRIKVIDRYPAEESLAVILSETRANGGGAFNVAKDLALMRSGLTVSGVGLLGDDEDGRWALAECARHGIGTARLRLLPDAPTSRTDVFTVSGTGRRTFFTVKGACARLDETAFDFTGSAAKIFYLAYLGLLDGLAAPSAAAGDRRPQAARVLQQAAAAGLRTAVDLVSIGADFAPLVRACLGQVDYFFANDVEAEQLTGVTVSGRRGAALEQALTVAAQKIVAAGVRQVCVLHTPGGAVAAGADGAVARQGSVRVPPGDIRGGNGCGDAFAAGFLYAMHEDWSLPAALELGVSVAAKCLRSASSSDAVTDWRECLRDARALGFRPEF
ncbi:MAG: carbohydrate kinase family protein [Verrucomicrobiales bacterium]|jgi:sugar/nucleoside kinase (ribokinase family)|nr:carbohydrate kinase family protein [Verrucomicrobiales bacterium]